MRGRGLKVALAGGLLALMVLGVGWDWWGQQHMQTEAREMREEQDEDDLALAPDVPFETLDGVKITKWTDVAEPEVRVHFWASWCTPCRVEMPHIMAYAKAHVGRVKVILVSTDDDEAAMRAAMRRWEKAPVWWVWDADKRLSLKTFQTLSVPETVLLDARRRMVDKWVGVHKWE